MKVTLFLNQGCFVHIANWAVAHGPHCIFKYEFIEQIISKDFIVADPRTVIY